MALELFPVSWVSGNKHQQYKLKISPTVCLKQNLKKYFEEQSNFFIILGNKILDFYFINL